MSGHLSEPHLVVRAEAPVLSFALGSCLIPAWIAGLHASLSWAFFSLRQLVIVSASGMSALQSLSTSGVHAKRCSSVPCAKQRAGEAVVSSIAPNAHRGAESADRRRFLLFWSSMFIGEPAMHSRCILDLITADIDTHLPELALVAKGQCL
jgi:hypothetical protein